MTVEDQPFWSQTRSSRMRGLVNWKSDDTHHIQGHYQPEEDEQKLAKVSGDVTENLATFPLNGFRPTERDHSGKGPRKNNLSNSLTVGQPPSAVIIPNRRGRLSHIQANASTELLKLFFRGS